MLDLASRSAGCWSLRRSVPCFSWSRGAATGSHQGVKVFPYSRTGSSKRVTLTSSQGRGTPWGEASADGTFGESS
jgi:hypothetical protein